MDKRKFLRFECLLPAEVVRVEGCSGAAGRAVIDDFSREGLRLVLNLEVDIVPGTRLDLQCTLPGGEGTVPAAGEVIWSRAEGGKWEFGMKIKEMAPEARCEILDACYLNWQEKKKR
ncbi:MAG: PilZ domain-containing protein [Candidatus Aminicenantales bacterium]